MNDQTGNHIPPMTPGVFSRSTPEGGPPQLLGGYCGGCDRYFFPRPRYCRKCLEPADETEIGSTGKIHSFTVVRTKPPLGLPRPYSVGYIDLDDTGLRIFCLLDSEQIDEFQVGSEVCLAVAPLGHDGKGEARLRPYFTLRK
jgi:uncharacterized OB-fold protein